jgi:hypothetical protein
VVFVAGVGVFSWTLAAFSTLVPLGNIGAVFAAYFMTYGGLIRSGQGGTSLEATPSALFQTMFWLMLASWMGAWLTLFSGRWLTQHGRLEAEHLAYLAALQSVVPFALPLIPLIYHFWSKSGRPKATRKGWSIEDWLPEAEEERQVKKRPTR